MLELHDVHSHYAGAEVLRGVGLTVQEGRCVALLGRNGMGKTTLIRSILGMSPPEVSRGEIRYRGQSLRGQRPHRIARMGIGLVPQGRRLFPTLTVAEHLRLGQRPAAAGSRAAAWTPARVCELFPRLAERSGHRGNQLSGGERQMLAIGRALTANPALILMDEPSEGLAPLAVQALGEQIKALRGEGLSILLVEQNLTMALDAADEFFILETGRVVFHGTREELARDPALIHRTLGV